jgi:hypothetical protein
MNMLHKQRTAFALQSCKHQPSCPPAMPILRICITHGRCRVPENKKCRHMHTTSRRYLSANSRRLPRLKGEHRGQKDRGLLAGTLLPPLPMCISQDRNPCLPTSLHRRSSRYIFLDHINTLNGAHILFSYASPHIHVHARWR